MRKQEKKKKKLLFKKKRAAVRRNKFSDVVIWVSSFFDSFREESPWIQPEIERSGRLLSEEDEQKRK